MYEDFDRDEDTEQLLRYKLGEVLRNYKDDLAKLPNKTVDEINEKITDPNIDTKTRIKILERYIRKIYRELIKETISEIKKDIKTLEKKQISLADIKVGIEKIQETLEKTLNIDELKDIYRTDMKEIKYTMADKMSQEKARRIEKKNDRIFATILAFITLIIGIAIGKII